MTLLTAEHFCTRTSQDTTGSRAKHTDSSENVVLTTRKVYDKQHDTISTWQYNVRGHSAEPAQTILKWGSRAPYGNEMPSIGVKGPYRNEMVPFR